jgi:hypothetical protein
VRRRGCATALRYPAKVTSMSKDTFFSMRQVNFILWIAALATTWHDPKHLPVGAQWIPFAGVIVALFLPNRRKEESPKVASANRPPDNPALQRTGRAAEAGKEVKIE